MGLFKFVLTAGAPLLLAGCIATPPKAVCPTFFNYSAEDNDMLLQEINGDGDHQVEKRFLRDYGKVRASERVLCPQFSPKVIGHVENGKTTLKGK